MRPVRSHAVAAGTILVGLAAACSSGDSGHGGDAGQPACVPALDAGFVNGPESVSASGQCGNVLTGTKKDGDACQSDAECTPACCTCPGGTRSAQVAWCNAGKCVAAQDTLCCAFLVAGASETDAGVPYVCQAP